MSSMYPPAFPASDDFGVWLIPRKEPTGDSSLTLSPALGCTGCGYALGDRKLPDHQRREWKRDCPLPSSLGRAMAGAGSL